ncbi:MASE3 domain-containing protein, partial [Desulfosporosinus sp. OT]|uniref:MASE3 domain-containing protein n=1 Tax=Desulfosporosinus sp. OT TaxID=913865 RepID=UPI00058FFBB9
MESKRKTLAHLVGGVSVIAGLYILESDNYLLFHSLAELFSIIIAVTLFLIMWNSNKYMKNKALVFISIGYLFIAIIDLLHTLSYQGMNIFKDYDFYANQLWIAARYMESLTLLVAFAWPSRVNQIINRVGILGIMTIYLVITVILMASIYIWKTFPVCFIANQGQTEFKIMSEYVICLTLVAGILFLWKNRRNLDEKIYTLLIAAMIFTILQELSFTLYSDNYGILNMVGHYFKILSFYLMYRAIVKIGIVEPYNLIIRELTYNEIELKEAKNAAELANNMKSSFLANMSHEIRTPLNSILGFANLLFEEEKEPEKLEKLEIIINAGDHLLSLVNNILEFSKIEAGMVVIEQSSFFIHKLLENLKKMFVLKSQERHLSWEVNINPAVPEIIVGDEHRLMQVLVNLTGNAFKFTESGGVSIQVSYLNGQLEIIVEDTGIGIPEAKQETIFSPFDQVETSYARKYGGTGLGLSITKNLLELMGGTIRVERSTVSGSEFVVSIPVGTVEMQKQDQREPADLVTSEPNSSGWVMFLVVDRNEPTEEVVMNIVKACSFDGLSVKVLPCDSKTKDRILFAGADLILMYESIGSSKMKLLAKDLKQDFRTSFLPVIFLKECSGDRVSFQADTNALKYGKTSQEIDLYGFISQVIQGREVFGRDMMKRWLEKAEVEMGTSQILLDCLSDIAVRVQALENALVDHVMENIQFLTHSLKGSTGTLRMSEVCLKVSDMDAELGKKPSDMEKVRKEFSSAKEMLALIPKKYFDMERLQLEKRKHAVGKLLILVVDDNVENQKLIGHCLDQLNLKYKNAENGEIALEMLRAESFSMILLDSQMPVMDGITTLKRIRGNSALKELHVIMQTASTFKDDVQEFFQAGCNDYISKPVDLRVLQRKLAEFIAQQES